MEVKESLNNQIEEYQSKVERAIDNELNKYKKSTFYSSLSYALEGGKRIRPLILLLSAKTIGDYKVDPFPAAVTVELLHTESIIHDDIFDKEISRRDKPTFHMKYGLEASVLSADFVFGIILDIASRYKESRIAMELSSAAIRMCQGELEELNVNPNHNNLTWNNYIRLISEKTASLFQTSSKIGGIIGGGNDEEIEALSIFGLSLGIAYQIRDDFLDWEKEEKVTKAIHVDNKTVDRLYLSNMSKFYAEEAKKSLRNISDSESIKNLLELVDFTISRNY